MEEKKKNYSEISENPHIHIAKWLARQGNIVYFIYHENATKTFHESSNFDVDFLCLGFKVFFCREIGNKMFSCDEIIIHHLHYIV